MSGPTKVDYTGNLLRAVFVEEIRRSYARVTKPDGTVVTPEMQTKRRRDEFTGRLQRLAEALEPVLAQIAAAQGGVPLSTGDPGFSRQKQAVDLVSAVGLSAGVYKLFVVVALPTGLSDAERERLQVVARKNWK